MVQSGLFTPFLKLGVVQVPAWEEIERTLEIFRQRQNQPLQVSLHPFRQSRLFVAIEKMATTAAALS
jgi:hypothetical protein